MTITTSAAVAAKAVRALEALDLEVAMTFEAYIENIKSKTGKTPEQLKKAAEAAGVYRREMKAV